MISVVARWVRRATAVCHTPQTQPCTRWFSTPSQNNHAEQANTLVWNEALKAKAQQLMFSSRKYSEFTPTEQNIVNLYQQKITEVDGGVILPNTRLELEQYKAEQLFQAWQRKSHPSK